MFLDELSPLFKELAQQPIAFLGGLASGILKLNLAEEPVKSWLEKQAGSSGAAIVFPSNNGKSQGPQTIAID